ncbi:uncharacterized protein LOC128671412 [Plodia interpunctella]|uniref:uncharacterized protein LOC128671412 n=1 Tax=Plodia interpunctella TaxID=58824 RepID=UPI0023685900|nr:uncharacterized protein LOC128671412 [Plodia interpunctella]
MRTVARDNLAKSVNYKCGSCAMLYSDYKQLVEHLYWRHGTESYLCKRCMLRQWHFAAHICNVLPTDGSHYDETIPAISQNCSNRETEYCFCGKYINDSNMIGCDGPQCTLKWYHFACVGIVVPPDGEWLCPQCVSQISRCTNIVKFDGQRREG